MTRYEWIFAVLCVTGTAGWVKTRLDLFEAKRELKEAIGRECAAKLELDVYRRQQLDAQNQWRGQVIPHEVRDDFET